jgi:hypothetical protein
VKDAVSLLRFALPIFTVWLPTTLGLKEEDTTNDIMPALAASLTDRRMDDLFIEAFQVHDVKTLKGTAIGSLLL